MSEYMPPYPQLKWKAKPCFFLLDSSGLEDVDESAYGEGVEEVFGKVHPKSALKLQDFAFDGFSIGINQTLGNSRRLVSINLGTHKSIFSRIFKLATINLVGIFGSTL
jgi:hypothetical protein